MYESCKIVKKKKAGFSLIELLTVIAIMVIMTTVGLAFLGGGRKQNDLSTAQREVAATINLARSYTLQGRSVGGSTPCGFGVRFTDSNSYEIFYIKPGSGKNCLEKNDTETSGTNIYRTCSSPDCIFLEKYSLKNGIKIQDGFTYPKTIVYFAVPHSNSFDGSGNALGGVSFNLKGTDSKTKMITVDISGSVKEE